MLSSSPILLAALATLTLSKPLPAKSCCEDITPLAATTIIPTTAFNSKSTLEQYFSYNYPWGPTHNGAARMTPANAIASSGTLTITAKSKAPESAKPSIKYDSGAVYAKQAIAMTKGGSVDFAATFIAPVAKGTWPAFWLTATKGWPPEIDIAEWKGSGKISFNTFNTSSQVSARDVAYPNPGQQHTVRGELRDINGKDVGFTFYMDGKQVVRQVGKGY
ncbi:Hypothetical protein D9617_10g074660 [Elsinoe fawcettii]|nr:Hypothetical protein D9617_10g074660 [Elsinoe fawcettii]